MAQFTLMSLVMLIAWYCAPNILIRKKILLSLIVIAILARLVLIGVDPYLSNDVDRYLFDGRIALAGYDPIK